MRWKKIVVVDSGYSFACWKAIHGNASLVEVIIRLSKSYDYLLITYMKKFNCRSVTEVRVRVSFVECLEFFWKT